MRSAIAGNRSGRRLQSLLICRGRTRLGTRQHAARVVEGFRLLRRKRGRTGHLVTSHARGSKRAHSDTRGDNALQRPHVIHDVPAIHLFDSVIGWHEPATIAYHAEDVAIGPRLGDVLCQIDSGHAEPRRRSISHRAIAMTHGAVYLEVLVSVGE